MKTRIEKTQQNSNCRLCGDKDETINHIIRECSKLAQGGQGDPLGSMQGIKMGPYKQMVYAQPTVVLENDIHKLLLDFDLHTDHLISGEYQNL